MSKKKAPPSPDLSKDPEFLRYLKENDREGTPAAGAIPNGHEGPYMPSKEELIEGARIAAEAVVRMAQARVKAAEEQINMLFQQEEEEQ